MTTNPEILFRSMRHRNFKLFFTGQLISLIGTWMQTVAQSWLIYRLTHSSALLGISAFTSQIPGFIISPISGVVADRHSRHRIVLITQICFMLLALILCVLTLLNVVQVWHILLLSAIFGIVNAFDIPARQSFLIDMVGKEDLSNAIALNSTLFNGSRIVGPAIGGIVVGLVGEGWCFFANGVSYLAVIFCLLVMKKVPHSQKTMTGSAWNHLQDGLRFVLSHREIKSLLILMGFTCFMGIPYTLLMPVFADQVLHGGPKTLGILMGMVGTGALSGALLLTTQEDTKNLNRWVFLSCLWFGVGVVLFGLSRNIYLSSIFLVGAGFAMMVHLASTNILIQSMVPDEYRGRVMAFYSMMFLGMSPIGSLAGGFIAKSIGAPITVIGGGIFCSLSAFWFKKQK